MARPVPMSKLPKGARVAAHQPALPTVPRRSTPRARNRYRCVRCPIDVEPFTSYAAVQRHVDDVHHGGRIELML